MTYCSIAKPCVTSLDVMSSDTTSPWLTTNGEGVTANANVLATIEKLFVVAFTVMASDAICIGDSIGIGSISAS